MASAWAFYHCSEKVTKPGPTDSHQKKASQSVNFSRQRQRLQFPHKGYQFLEDLLLGMDGINYIFALGGIKRAFTCAGPSTVSRKGPIRKALPGIESLSRSSQVTASY